MLCDKLTRRGKIKNFGIFKCLAFKCYLKGFFYYAYMQRLTHFVCLITVAIFGLQIIMYFSHKHNKLLRFQAQLQGLARFNSFHLIV
jgi:hypothetical protein